MVDRKVRKVVSYLCTECFRTFPHAAAAKAHWREAHYVPVPKRRRGRPRKEGCGARRGKAA